jgi:DNA-binding HxlR family transcriptional regulator
MKPRRPPKESADDLHRSLCPINLSLEVFGDKWTLLVVRDLMFAGRRHFRELLTSEEGIASNILADRLNRLLAEGVITKVDDPTHKQKAIYSLTEKGIDLLPIFVAIGAWGRKYCPVSDEMGWRAEALEKGGKSLFRALQAEIRRTHLGNASGRAPRATSAKRSTTPITDYLGSADAPRPRAVTVPRPTT